MKRNIKDSMRDWYLSARIRESIQNASMMGAERDIPDANNATTPGIWEINTALNLPQEGQNWGAGVLEVLQKGSYYFQRITHVINGVAIRTKHRNETQWSPWKILS